MKTLHELTEERNRLKSELIELEKAIGRHPDTIRSYFRHNPTWDMTAFEEVVKRVSFVKESDYYHEVFGDWRGFIYLLDGKIYRVQFGNTAEMGPLKQEEPVEMDVVRSMWEADDPVAYLKGMGVTEDWKLVGFLLFPSIYDYIQ